MSPTFSKPCIGNRDERPVAAAKERPIGGTGAYNLEGMDGIGNNEWDEYGEAEYDGVWGGEDGDDGEMDSRAGPWHE